MSVMKGLGGVFYEELGRKLKEVRRKTGLKQGAVGLAMRFKPARGGCIFCSLAVIRLFGLLAVSTLTLGPRNPGARLAGVLCGSAGKSTEVKHMLTCRAYSLQ